MSPSETRVRPRWLHALILTGAIAFVVVIFLIDFVISWREPRDVLS